MNKTELIAQVAEKTGTTRKDAEQVISTMLEVIGEELAAGGRVQLVGFGAFETKHREPRIGRNPRTKEAVEIPATTVPVFKAGKALKEKQLGKLRRGIGMIFQHFNLMPSRTVAGNVAYPLREHTQLPAPLLHSTVMMKLEAVGLRGAAKLMPSELSGGMARRAALARAIALEPDLIMFDEPFVGQDPITMGVLVKLISELNSALGVTCVVVSHDVPEVLSIADHAWILADKKIVAHGSAQALQANPDPRVRQFLDGIADGPVPFRYPAGDYHADLLPGS